MRGRIAITIEADEGDEDRALVEIREAIGPGWTVEWTGDSNTDREGVTSADIAIDWEG